MTITKGSYKATVRKNADGQFYALVTYADGRGVPGVPGRHYDTKKNAEAGAKRMLAKC